MVMRGRRLDGAPAASLDLNFSGTFPTTSTFLASTLIGKVKKSYTRYADGDLWLLVYDESGMATEASAIELARLVLANTKHPFAAAWVFVPFPAEDGGMLEALHQ